MKMYFVRILRYALQAVVVSLLSFVPVAPSFGSGANTTVFGWGFDWWGQVSTVPGWPARDFWSGPVMLPPGQVLVNVVISPGAFHSLALKAGGALVGWGEDSYGEATGVPNPAAPNCSSGPVTNANTGQVLTGVVAISSGSIRYHNLAILNDSTVFGWGLNVNGQATGVPSGPSGPVIQPPGVLLSNVVAVSGGEEHSLALLSNNTVFGWGHNNYGQARGNTNSPEFWSGLVTNPGGQVLSNVVAIAAGGYHSLALKRDGTVYAWGYDYYGESTGYSNTTVVPYFSCGLVVNPDTGQLLSSVAAISAGDYHSLALLSNGTVVAWGAGHGPPPVLPDSVNNAQSFVPPGLAGVVAIAAGGFHSLALKSDGTLTGWGFDYYGQATGIPNRIFPYCSTGDPVTNLNSGQLLTNVVSIAAGRYHDLANIAIAASPPPCFTNVTRITISTTNYLVFGGTNGMPNGSYSVLTSTDVGLSVNFWTLAGTGEFNAQGEFGYTNVMNPADGQKFYRLEVP